MNDCKHFLAITGNARGEGIGWGCKEERACSLKNHLPPSPLPQSQDGAHPHEPTTLPHPGPQREGLMPPPPPPAGGHRPMRASCDEDPGNQAASPPPRRGDNSVASPPSISRSCNQHQPQKHSQKQKTCVVQVLPCQDSAFPRASDATGMSEYTLCGGRGHLALCPACSVQAKSRLKAWSSAPSPGHGGSKA